MGFSLGKHTTPCMGCEDRYPACHGECERYKAWRAEYDAQKAEGMKVYELNYGLTAQRIRSQRRSTNRKLYRSKYRKAR